MVWPIFSESLQLIHIFFFYIYRCHVSSNFCTTWKIKLRILFQERWWYLTVAELVKPSMVLRFLTLKCYINLCFILFLCHKIMTEDILRSCLTWQQWIVWGLFYSSLTFSALLNVCVSSRIPRFSCMQLRLCFCLIFVQIWFWLYDLSAQVISLLNSDGLLWKNYVSYFFSKCCSVNIR